MAPERDKILFLTSSEHGQTTVIFATIHELLLRDQFDIHLASHRPAEPRLRDLFEGNKGKYPKGANVSFHAINAPSMKELLERDGAYTSMAHPPGFWGAFRAWCRVDEIVWRRTGDEYMECVRSCIQILKEVRPVLAVVEPFCPYAIDACMSLDLPYVWLSPLTYSSMITMLQPRAAFFWKYPAIGTGFRYPVPWYLIPANIAVTFVIIFISLTASRVKNVNRARAQKGLTWTYPGFEVYRKDRLHLAATLPELDYDYIIPDNVIGCGPIVLPTDPVASTDPELAKWLDRGPTVLINLGTHAFVSEADVVEMAIGLRSALETRPDVQILWKLKTEREVKDHEDILSQDIRNDRVRIVPWLDVEPNAILEHRNTVCYVHHGGANAFFEACHAGSTHVVLPQWYDTYEMARQAERLGVGAYGNQTTAPRVNAEELGKAMRVALSPEAEANARRIADICKRKEGRVAACEKITEAAEAESRKSSSLGSMGE